MNSGCKLTDMLMKINAIDPGKTNEIIDAFEIEYRKIQPDGSVRLGSPHFFMFLWHKLNNTD